MKRTPKLFIEAAPEGGLVISAAATRPGVLGGIVFAGNIADAVEWIGNAYAGADFDSERPAAFLVADAALSER